MFANVEGFGEKVGKLHIMHVQEMIIKNRCIIETFVVFSSSFLK